MSTTEVAAEVAAVSVQNVVKIYQRDSQQITVLDRLNLEVPQGEFLALMGPSGSGKTTLLNLIAGIDRATSGTVRVAGTELTPLSEGELAKWRSRNVGFIFQFYNLIPVLNAVENVELPLLLSHLAKKERRERALTALRSAAWPSPASNRAPRACIDCAAHRWPCRPVEALSAATVWRTGAARRYRARHRDRSGGVGSRRAHWRSRQQKR